ncbi:MAG TPA: pilus assembly protein PilM [Phycisphaerae bacterium]|nr:pilus assembly protein PilM [Phycisphaerae bacterium]
MTRILPIGLDVGHTTVRMLQLGGSLRDLRVMSAARFVIPQEARQDAALRREVVVEGIRRSLREHPFRRREAVMALSDEHLAVRNIRLPGMSEEERATAVNWEAQNKFPFDTATAVIQHVRAGEVHQGDQVLDEIILLAAPRAEVDLQIALAREARLDLVSLDAPCCALFRGFERFLKRREDENVVSAFVDLGARTTIVMARGREIVFVKAIPIGGAVFNRAVAECLELSATEAEALRRRTARRPPKGPEDDDGSDQVGRAVFDAIRPHLEDLANEIGLCLRYFAVTFRGGPMETVVFVGGEAHDPAVLEALAARLGVRAEVGDPFRNVRTDEIGPVLDRRGCRSEWATVFGLSLKGFCLADGLESPLAA